VATHSSTGTSTSTSTGASATTATVIAPSATVTPSVTASAPVSTDVIVELTADAPIESVRVPGSKRVELAASTAHVTLDPWSAPLKVEATLEGGKKVTATLEPGTKSAHLAPAKAKTTGVTTTTATTIKPDLQGNPYP
jgi:hypothetical protein